jgi:hypothetical protein
MNQLRDVTEYVVPASKISVDALQFTEIGLTVKCKAFVDVSKNWEVRVPLPYTR